MPLRPALLTAALLVPLAGCMWEGRPDGGSPAHIPYEPGRAAEMRLDVPRRADIVEPLGDAPLAGPVVPRTPMGTASPAGPISPTEAALTPGGASASSATVPEGTPAGRPLDAAARTDAPPTTRLPGPVGPGAPGR